MAQQTIHTLRQWFTSKSRPKQDHFWDWLDSFWHKDEQIPGEMIDGLKEALDTKLSLPEAALIEDKADTALGQTATLDGDMSALRTEMADADATLGVGVAKNSEDITALQHNLDNAWESIYTADGEVEEAIANTAAARDAANEAAQRAEDAATSISGVGWVQLDITKFTNLHPGYTKAYYKDFGDFFIFKAYLAPEYAPDGVPICLIEYSNPIPCDEFHGFFSEGVNVGSRRIFGARIGSIGYVEFANVNSDNVFSDDGFWMSAIIAKLDFKKPIQNNAYSRAYSNAYNFFDFKNE